MAVSSIRLSHGRTPFGKGGKLSQQSLRGVANRVEVQIRAKRLPETMKPLYEELAKEHRRRVAAVARGMYYGAVEQTILAAVHTDVPVQQSTPPAKGERATYRQGSRSSRRYSRWDERPMVPVNIVRRFQPFANGIPKSLDGDRGSSGQVREIFDRSKLRAREIQDIRAVAKIDKSWRALRVDYARRRPQSEVFFKKQKIAAPALLALLASVRPRLKAPSSYQKGRAMTFRFSSGRENPHLKASFTINYPELPGQWDFLRQAFLTNYPVRLSVSGRLRGAERVIGAETMRPLMVPLARQFGQKYRLLLGKLK